MLSIIVPTYNEAENLEEFIKKIKGSVNNLEYEIIIVDDNSPDVTGTIAESLRKTYHSIDIIHRSKKMGISSAIMDGIKIAKGDIIATLNSDFQHPIEYLPKMAGKIGKFDIVIGSRYVSGGNTEGWNLWRLIASRIGIFIAYMAIPQIRQIKDPLSGFFVLKKEIVKNIYINPSVVQKYLLEILVRDPYRKVVEVPYVFKNRRGGSSKVNFRDSFNYLRQLFILHKKSRVI